LAPGLQGPRDLGEERVDGSEVPGGLVAAEAVAGTGHHEVRTRSYAPPRLRIPQTAKGTATIRPDRGDTGTRLKDQHQPDRPIKTLGEPPPGAPAGPTSYCPIHWRPGPSWAQRSESGTLEGPRQPRGRLALGCERRRFRWGRRFCGETGEPESLRDRPTGTEA